jgi:antirestriction protein ArdC
MSVLAGSAHDARGFIRVVPVQFRSENRRYVICALAELGAAFLCADLGITPEQREDHASHLAHWPEIL